MLGQQTISTHDFTMSQSPLVIEDQTLHAKSYMEKVEKSRSQSTVKGLTKQLHSVTAKSTSAIAELKHRVKVETREKDDYLRKYMLATKEVSKLKDLLEHSEQIRQNQCALIKLQKGKIRKMQGLLEDALIAREIKETQKYANNTTSRQMNTQRTGDFCAENTEHLYTETTFTAGGQTVISEGMEDSCKMCVECIRESQT